MSKGFTLIELLIVISIIGILTVVSFPYYQSARQQLALQRAASKLAQDIRKVQEMAMSVQECEECGGIIPETGYGIYLDKGWEEGKRYRLYADTAGGNEFYTPADTIVEPPYIEIEKGVLICSINTNPGKISINFRSPDPDVEIKYPTAGGSDADIDDDEAEIILGTDCLSGKTKTITVNKVGLITVE